MNRCLIVDDQEQNLYMLEVLLKGNGCEVESAVNGLEALEKARRSPPDIIVSDILMPVMDGFTLCREWRRDERLKKIPFIFYTATYTDPKDEAFALNLGADRFLVKPLDPETLVREIASFLLKRESDSKAPADEKDMKLPESDYLKEYNEVLIRKLEAKMLHLEQANRSLEGEIRERRLVEGNLRVSEARYRDMFTNAVEGIYRSTREGRFLVVNPSFARMYGYETPQEMIDGIFSVDRQVYCLAEDRDRINAELEEKGSIRDMEVRHRRKDGSPFWVSLTSRVIRDGEGEILFYEGRVVDITDRKQAEEKIREGMDRLQQALRGVIQVLVRVVEQRDPYTAGHQMRVADLAGAIAGELSLDEEETEGIRMAGMVHDVGKMSIPAEILSKSAGLNNMEMMLIREHPETAVRILREIQFPWEIARTVLEHHERMDGSGYPQGLKEGQILLSSRILAVADTVESMASHRPYRPALGVDAALAEIGEYRGIRFDADVVDACIRLFREKGYQLKEPS
ncbi:MAG: response regulator [Syntrophaceae bacterium]|nr:response regulator [Syntrophaceae bacterium]